MAVADDRSPSPAPIPASSSGVVAGGGGSGQALHLHPASASSSRRLPPPCWIHEETMALIDSYREKWYALRRGNLRASHWQEVADAVAHRTSRVPSSSPKTSVQCRHKVEKLRKRYRAERARYISVDPAAPSSSWPYFPKMDSMERGLSAPNPIPIASARPSPSSSSSSSASSSDDDDGDTTPPTGNGTTRSLHNLMANGHALHFMVPKAVRSKPRPDDRPPNRGAARPPSNTLKQRGKKKPEGGGLAREMAAALQALGDGFMRVEQMKMEMVQEMEKVRMDMELKRTEMVLDAQRRIVDAFVKGLSCPKKRARLSPEEE